MGLLRRLIRTAVVCAALIAVCVGTCRAVGPTWAQLCALAAAPRQTLHEVGADRVVVMMGGVLLWILCGWLTLAVGCCALGTVPGRSGRVAGHLGRLISPRLVRRACGVAVGVGLAPAVIPSVAGAMPAYAAVVPVLQGEAVSAETAGVDWPAAATPAAQVTVTVHPGDCLWSLAEAHLGYDATTAQISAEVDRWWEANADVIGADPDRLIPGQVLTVPTG